LLGEHGLEVVDVRIARLPDRLLHQLVHAHDEHILVVRPVEDRDLTEERRAQVDAPKEVVAQLFRRRNAERHNVDAARIQPADDVLDRPVLPRAVTALEDDQQAVLLRAPHQVLEHEQLVIDFAKTRLRIGFLQFARRSCRYVAETDLSARGVENLHVRHVRNSSRLPPTPGYLLSNFCTPGGR